jgi:hypothetical protein
MPNLEFRLRRARNHATARSLTARALCPRGLGSTARFASRYRSARLAGAFHCKLELLRHSIAADRAGFDSARGARVCRTNLRSDISCVRGDDDYVCLGTPEKRRRGPQLSSAVPDRDGDAAQGHPDPSSRAASRMPTGDENIVEALISAWLSDESGPLAGFSSRARPRSV